MYIKNPSEIEKRSFEIIEENLKSHSFSQQELLVVKRTIHTTGDFDYKNIVAFRNNPIEAGLELLKRGCSIYTDTRMAYSGINKKTLEKLGCTIECLVDDSNVAAIAKEKGITRSMAAVEYAGEKKVDIFVIGNAPTALFRLGELINEGKASPGLIVGVPVGFVGASESKEYIREFSLPTISTVGTKGGSNVAASIINALLYMLVDRNG